jgi:uncharacterized protein YutD
MKVVEFNSKIPSSWNQEHIENNLTYIGGFNDRNSVPEKNKFTLLDLSEHVRERVFYNGWGIDNLGRTILRKPARPLILDSNLNLSEFSNVVEVYAYGVRGLDLSVFNQLPKLRKLDIGMEWKGELEKRFKIEFKDLLDGYTGSLKSLENCKDLEFLCIANLKSITEGLEYLPLDNLKHFGCWGTIFQDILKPYDYDILAWKLVNHPNFFSNWERKEKIEQKIREAQKFISDYTSPYGGSIWLDGKDTTKKKGRLKIKIDALQKALEVFSSPSSGKVVVLDGGLKVVEENYKINPSAETEELETTIEMPGSWKWK